MTIRLFHAVLDLMMVSIFSQFIPLTSKSNHETKFPEAIHKAISGTKTISCVRSNS